MHDLSSGGPHSPPPDMDLALKLADATARRVERPICDPAFDQEDVRSEAYLAAIKAARSWRADGGQSFRTRIVTQVRYAILEYYRVQDWLSRTDRKKENARDAAIEWSDDPDERRRLAAERPGYVSRPVSLDDVFFEGEEDEPSSGRGLVVGDRIGCPCDSDAVHLRVDLSRVVSRLSPRHRQVLRWIYWRGVPQAALAVRMGISPSRIQQLHHGALAALRDELLADGLV